MVYLGIYEINKNFLCLEYTKASTKLRQKRLVNKGDFFENFFQNSRKNPRWNIGQRL